MKFLLFSDLHANRAATSRILERAPSFDILIGAGDFANVREGLKNCIDILRKISQPTILVPGNHETNDELIAACRGWSSAYVLHGTSVTLNGLTFYGVGGGIPVTPFGTWSYDFSEDQAKGLVADCPAGCILVSHSPPNGVLDVSSQRKHLGSTTISETIGRVHPLFVACGHIHASAGQTAMLDSTPVINAGAQGFEWVLSR